MGYLHDKKKEVTETTGDKVPVQENPQENLLGVFSILLAVAKRTNPKKYLIEPSKKL